jgi:DNA-binding LacI/PurR family transcriptional regulator
VTINDIARAAGVSKGSVSFALNGQPGVSAETRERILAIARDLGWRPSTAARALSNSESRAVGFALARSPALLGSEPYFMQIIAGVESVLAPRSIALVFQMVDDVDAEVLAYEQWWAERRVDGVLVNDLRLNDPRVAYLQQLGMPAAIFGLPRARGTLAAVRFDEMVTMREIVGHLAELGHQRIARVAGSRKFKHTALRTRAMRGEMERRGLPEATIVHADFSDEESTAATAKLLAGAAPPTAIIYDSDIMAVAGLRAANDCGRLVPAELSIVAIGNSPFYDLLQPALTATERDVVAFGARGARALLDILAGNPAQTISTPAARLVIRASTAPPHRD